VRQQQSPAAAECGSSPAPQRTLSRKPVSPDEQLAQGRLLQHPRRAHSVRCHASSSPSTISAHISGGPSSQTRPINGRCATPPRFR
jgi:hypothetical protein